MSFAVLCLTSDRNLWAVKPFCYLFNLYWSELQDVVIAGYSPPDFNLPRNFHFYQIDPQPYPAERWSNGLIKACSAITDDHLVLLLEDYWLCRTVDVRGVAACYDYICHRPEVLRIDLTGDRLYAGGMFDVESWGNYDIIETPSGTPYQFSTQAGIWNRRLLLSLLIPGKSGWETEIQTAPPPGMRVLGTRQSPVRYANALLKGALDEHQLALIPHEHMSAMSERGWINGSNRA